MGRSSGSDGIDKARRHIISEFYNAGIEMAGESYSYGFYFWAGGERILGINIVGMIPAGKSVENPKTILIGAHYDGLGVLGGKIYPGADNNASGVAAMIEIGKAFAELSRQGNAPDCNICLVAFDASNLECEGSLKLLSDKIIEPSDISLMINLDQIGTPFFPKTICCSLEWIKLWKVSGAPSQSATVQASRLFSISPITETSRFTICSTIWETRYPSARLESLLS